MPDSWNPGIFFSCNWRSGSVVCLRERRHLHFYRSFILGTVSFLSIRFLNFSTSDVLGLVVMCIARPQPAECWHASSLPQATHPDTPQLWPSQWSADIAKCPPAGQESPLVENHYLSPSSALLLHHPPLLSCPNPSSQDWSLEPEFLPQDPVSVLPDVNWHYFRKHLFLLVN